jgi:hypothetical protein
MKKKLNMIVCIVIVVVSIAYFVWYVVTSREIRIDTEQHGIETVGTVTRKLKGGNPLFEGFKYGVRFEFEDNNGNRVVVSNNIKSDYENAVIGMTYKVRFLPNNPQRSARIFIDQPRWLEVVK